jgi:hypothetical protein
LEAELAQNKQAQTALRQELEAAQQQLQAQQERAGAEQSRLEARARELQADVEQQLKRLTEALVVETGRRERGQQADGEWPAARGAGSPPGGEQTSERNCVRRVGNVANATTGLQKLRQPRHARSADQGIAVGALGCVSAGSNSDRRIG